MKTPIKLVLTGVALFLVVSGGVDFGLTTVPGIALLAYVWGFSASGGDK